MAGRDGKKLIVESLKITEKRTTPRLRVEDEKRLEDALGPGLYSALKEVEEAYRAELEGQGYPHEAGFMEKIPSTATHSSDWISDRIKRLQKWRDKLPTRMHRAITLDICVWGFTARETAYQRGSTHPTIMKYLREALEVW